MTPKRFLLRLLSLAALIASAVAPAWAQVEVTIGDVTGGPGGSVTIPVQVNDLTGMGITSYRLDVLYDPAALSLTGVNAGGTLSSGSLVVPNALSGELRIAAAGAAPISGAGTLINLVGTLVGGQTTLTVNPATVAFEDPGNPGFNPTVDWLEGVATTQGSVVAAATQAVTASATYAFPGTAVSLTLNGVAFDPAIAAGRVKVRLYDAAPPDTPGIADGFTAGNHRWIVSSSSGITGFAATSTLTIDHTAVSVDNIALAGIVGYKRENLNGGSFAAVATVNNPAPPATVLSGFTSFSEFALAAEATMPVELVDFTAAGEGDRVHLRWATASELDNLGFEIQHAPPVQNPESDIQNWQTLAFVEGAGTTQSPEAYAYTVEAVPAGRHRFRLKQIDYDGAFSFSPEVEVVMAMSERFVLEAAYPNPFNPQTQFSLTVARAQRVRVEVYDALGRRVALLYDGVLPAQQRRPFTVDASSWPSGSYFIRATGDDFTTARQIVLLR